MMAGSVLKGKMRGNKKTYAENYASNQADEWRSHASIKARLMTLALLGA